MIKYCPLLGKTPLAKKTHEKSLVRFNDRLKLSGWLGKNGTALSLGQVWLL
jgi:hypothetical protein